MAVFQICNQSYLEPPSAANLTYGIDWLENEIKKKEYNLSTLNNRTRQLTYRGDEIYPMNSTKELTYRADKIYPTLMDDKTIRPVSSNMRLVRSNDTYKSDVLN
ncbi:MAG: hypothetical protein M3P08_12320 [Thermoproteota archaeon]|nr:hypothetical protein [Thermoproteota archaeon]